MRPPRIALLTSHRAEGLPRLLADPNRGSAWELAIVVGSETALENATDDVPLELRPIRHDPAFRNLRAREAYDQGLAELLLGVRADYILLDGWQYILTEPLLSAFPERILAIHDADLSQRERIYAGPHAVRDALFAGEIETRSSVYVVTRDVAHGPLFLLGPAYPVAHMALDARDRGDADFLTQYAHLHRRWMISTSWGDMLIRTIELLVAGTHTTIGDTVWIDGAPGPCRFGESPRACHEPEAMVSRGIPRSCPFIG